MRLKKLNEEAAKRHETKDEKTKKSLATNLDTLSETVMRLNMRLKKLNEEAAKRHETKDENRRQVEVSDPTGFSTSEENKVFSGPQPGEKLPPLQATDVHGGAKIVWIRFHR